MPVRNPRIRGRSYLASEPEAGAPARALIPVACTHDFCHSVSLVILRLCNFVTCCYSAIALCACPLVYAALILVLSPLARTPMH
jgi:hypothetical protein